MIVVILAGISGAGKSTLAKTFANSKTVVCSADHFFLKEDGSYRFDYSLLGEAHKSCQNKFKKAILDKTERILVDNTNLTSRERSFYCRQALENKYTVYTVVLSASIEECANRNIHSVPKDTIINMSRKLDLKSGVHLVTMRSPGEIGYSYLGSSLTLPL